MDLTIGDYTLRNVLLYLLLAAAAILFYRVFRRPPVQKHGIDKASGPRRMPTDRASYGLKFSSSLPSSSASEDSTPVAQQKLPRTFRVVLGGFLSVWLLGWTAGMGAAFSAFRSMDSGDPAKTFLALWLLFAAAGWLIAMSALIRIAIQGRLPNRLRKKIPFPDRDSS